MMLYTEFHFGENPFSEEVVASIEYNRNTKQAIVDSDDKELQREISLLLRRKKTFKVAVGKDKIDDYKYFYKKKPTENIEFMFAFVQTLWAKIEGIYLIDYEEVVDG